MTQAEKANYEKQSALQKQIKLNKKEIEELKADNNIKDNEMSQLKFNDSLSLKSGQQLISGSGLYNASSPSKRGAVTAQDVLDQSLGGSENAVDSPNDGAHGSPVKEGDLSTEQQQILVNLVKVKD